MVLKPLIYGLVIVALSGFSNAFAEEESSGGGDGDRAPTSSEESDDVDTAANFSQSYKALIKSAQNQETTDSPAEEKFHFESMAGRL